MRLIAGLGAGLLALGLLMAAAVAALGAGPAWLDALNQAVQPLIWTGLATALLAFGLGARRAGLAAGSAALILLAVFVGAATPLPVASPSADDPVSLYVANLWVRNDDVAAMARSVAAADADIVGLIEAGALDGADLDRILVGYPYRVTSAPLRRWSGAEARMVIASRYPLDLQPQPADGLAALAARVRPPGRAPIDLTLVHLTRPWPFVDPRWQRSQIDRLIARLGTAPRRTVIAGDFNSAPTTGLMRRLGAATGLVMAPGLTGTWPTFLPAPLRTTIDHVLVSPDLRVVSRRTGRPTGSDHRPVVVSLSGG